MKINKQSNVYTVVYIILLVVIVGTALAFTSLSLHDRQQANADADKMRQILASAHIEAGNDVAQVFADHIVGQVVYRADGSIVEGIEAFDVNVADEAKKPAQERLLPIYVCNVDNAVKFIIPLSGAGLWGPIWGYVAFNDDDSHSIYGAFFDHQGETPGLGAEITKPDFTNQFVGKSPFLADGRFTSIAVVKAGMKPLGDEEYVDGISGGTITSKGVGAMLDNCLRPYEVILSNLKNK